MKNLVIVLMFVAFTSLQTKGQGPCAPYKAGRTVSEMGQYLQQYGVYYENLYRSYADEINRVMQANGKSFRMPSDKATGILILVGNSEIGQANQGDYINSHRIGDEVVSYDRPGSTSLYLKFRYDGLVIVYAKSACLNTQTLRYLPTPTPTVSQSTPPVRETIYIQEPMQMAKETIYVQDDYQEEESYTSYSNNNYNMNVNQNQNYSSYQGQGQQRGYSQSSYRPPPRPRSQPQQCRQQPQRQQQRQRQYNPPQNQYHASGSTGRGAYNGGGSQGRGAYNAGGSTGKGAYNAGGSTGKGAYNGGGSTGKGAYNGSGSTGRGAH